MPEKLGRIEQRALFYDLMLERPDADPVQLAKEAGIDDPGAFVQHLAEVESRKQDRKANPGKRPTRLSDRDKALAALRFTLEKGRAPQRVAAAKALIEASPEPQTQDANDLTTVVVFRGVEGVSGMQSISADIDPTELAEAIDFIRNKRRNSEDTQLEQYALERGLDTDEVGLAWELYSHPEARAAGLRVLLLSSPVDDESEALEASA